MDLGLKGRVAWVHGGSSGLGRGSAEALAREGAHVAISARDPERLTHAAREISEATGGRCIPVPLDVSDAAAIPAAHEKAVNELGPIDILVANSGGPPPGSFDTNTDDQMDAAVDLLIKSAWHLTRAVLPSMKERRRGVLMYVTSSTTKEVTLGLLLSNMMRAAVVGMAKTLSKELGPQGIRVLCLVPGRIRTPRVESLDRNRAEGSGRSVEEIEAASQSAIPLGRYGEPKEFGDVAAFLASERASYMSGTSVVVDGGMLDGVLT
jgi:3-oxoacyl-[acyl-carrier protein] reductase